MNTKNIVALLAIMFLHLSAQAQVIKEIQDSPDELTTVVIKKESESDYDILNEQFDLDEMGMHQVVRITTGGAVVLDEPTPEVPEQTPEVIQVEKPAPLEEEVIMTNLEQVNKSSEPKEAVKESPKQDVVQVKESKPAASEKYTAKSSNRRTSFKPYYDKRRFKKKKRKKRSRRSKRRGDCYRF